jgi:phage shock protein PspC (stress-responsive transcriptional regulator)
MYDKLYRSRKNYMIAGICGGLGEYFKIDPTIIRLIMVFSMMLAGTGLLIYLIAWIVIPLEPAV